MTTIARPEPSVASTAGGAGTWVVGHDGSSGADAALRWAAAQASGPDTTIEIVRAWQYPYYDLLPASSWSVSTTMAKDLEKSIGEELSALARDSMTTQRATFTSSAVLGPTVDVLLERADPAELLVVGSRGLGGVGRFALGSVSHRLACRTPRPLVIVPDTTPPDPAQRVVVGVDGSPNALAALRWAAGFVPDTAEIIAVCAWSGADERRAGADDIWDHLRDAARERFESSVDVIAADVGRVDGFERIFTVGRGRATLSSFAVDADLLVVGARGRSGITGVITGSTTTWLSHHLRCATAIVPSERAGASQ